MNDETRLEVRKLIFWTLIEITIGAIIGCFLGNALYQIFFN